MPYDESLIQSIAERHGLGGELRLLPKGGMVNEAWAIGDQYILRIVEEGVDEEADVEAAREAAVVPLVQRAGVTTPTLVAFDATTDFAPRPYTIYERVDGELVGFSERGYSFFEPAWRKIGEDLAVLHSIEVPAEDTPKIYVDEGPRHQKWVERALERETIDRATAEDIEATIERWSEVGGPLPAPRLIHNDLHPWNLLASPRLGGLAAIIDWGDASFGDPARDFAMMPLPCVPTMLEAYTDDLPLRAQLLARSLVVGVAVALFEWCSPEMRQFNRDWWRMPRGGWQEMKATCHEFAPRYS